MTTSQMTRASDSASGVRPERTGKSSRFAGKRVAMVTFSLYPYDPRPRRALDALVGEGATVDLICLGNDGAPKREKLDSINVLRLPIRHDRSGRFAYAYRYAAFILTSAIIFAFRALGHRYDLVYVHNMPDILVLSALIPKALGAKVVLDLHDPMPELMMTIFKVPENSKSVQLLKRFEKWSIARANLVVTVNLACKHIFSARSCGPEKIAVVMNAPDSKIFPFRTPQEHSRGEAAGKPFVIMYHGSLVERNGLDLAVEALAQARERIPAAELRVYGPSTPFLERVLQTAREKGLEGVVRFLGRRRLEELVKDIEACDVGVIPNQRNPFTDINTPTRIFEYLAIGKPVIAPSTMGIKDYFNDESLLFFEPGDAADLARKMEYAYAHRYELSQIASHGQEIYLAHTWDRERETLLSRVSEILNNN
jgi:glycosyltransferase involved in cell wall biosynthesis